MKIGDVIFRSGLYEDCYRIAELDNIASSGAIEYLFDGLIPGLTATQVVARNLESDTYPYTYKSAVIAEYQEEIIGFSLSYPAQYHEITDDMRRFFPEERLKHFKHFFSNRIEGSYYLDVISVDQKYRNAGVGSQLLNLTKEKARKESFDVLSLLAFADNHSAIRLYERYGFKVERRIELKPHELIPHEGGCLLMSWDFS